MTRYRYLAVLLILVLSAFAIGVARGVYNECRDDGHTIAYCVSLVSS